MRPCLDPIDLKILATLQKEGRITKLALAERVNLSPTPCWTRLKGLEKAGFVKAYRAEIDFAKLGSATTVLVEITLKQHRYEDFEVFKRAVRRVPEIIECFATAGGVDYLLKVVTKDIDAYQRLMNELLTAGFGRSLLHVCGDTDRQDDAAGTRGLDRRRALEARTKCLSMNRYPNSLKLLSNCQFWSKGSVIFGFDAG